MRLEAFNVTPICNAAMPSILFRAILTRNGEDRPSVPGQPHFSNENRSTENCRFNTCICARQE
jgi:hypothetical protein